MPFLGGWPVPLDVSAVATVAAPPHFRAERATSPIVLDGKLDDQAWQDAHATDAFTQKFPDDGAPPTDRTTMRIVYDDDALYVGFECEQTHSKVIARMTRRDRDVEGDYVYFALDTRRDGKSAFVFSVYASGVQYDGIEFNDTDFSVDWDENWEVRTDITPRGWTAEFKIPFRALRFQSLPVQSWGLQAARHISERLESDVWAYTPRSVAGEVSHYGKLDDLRGLTARTPFELRPFVLGRVRRRDAATGQLTDGTNPNISGTTPYSSGQKTDFLASAGVDIKWHPTQDLTLDATVNPDFAQVEADQVVLNLSTYETYYPEKRPFFLEGIDAFALPIQLVYTRRIGRLAPLPNLRTSAPFNDQLADLPEPATIYGAAKLTGRLADRWSVATLQAVTARNDIDVVRADGSHENRLADPLTAFNVVRVKRDLGTNASLGFTATATTHAEPTGEYPLVPPNYGTAPATQVACPNGYYVSPGSRCYNDAYVASVDGRWRSDSGDYVLGAQALTSILDKGPGRTVSDGTTINPGDVGAGGTGYVAKEGGEHWVGDVWGSYMNRELDVNDLGYNRRANIWGGGVDAEYRTLTPWWETLETHTRLETWARDNLDELNLARGVNLNTAGRLKNFWRYFVEAHVRATHFDDREVGDGTALERKGSVGNDVNFGTDPTKRVAFQFHTTTDFLFDGFSFSGDAGAVLRVLPQLDVEILPTALYTYGEPRFAGYGTANGSYIFGDLDAKALGATLRATYTFTPHLTLQSYAQLFLASGHYGNFSTIPLAPTGPRPVVRLSDLLYGSPPPPTSPDFEQGVFNVNVVLRWEYRLGSLLYVVYTRSQIPTVVLTPGEAANLNFASVGRTPGADILLVKVSYWWG